MRHFCITLAVAWALFITTAQAQPLSCDSTATPLDTFSLGLTIGAGSFTGTGSLTVVWDVIRMVSPQGPSFTINPTSIAFTGDTAAINATTTLAIFNMIGHTTASQAVALGYLPCSISCTSPDTAVVRLPACVERLGSGEETHFAACGSGCCTRRYAVCCPTGLTEPLVILISADGAGCEGRKSGCEATCP